MSTKFLKRKIYTIFLMLGNECNLSCTYCLQHPLVHEPLDSQINPDVIEFIKEVAEENDGDELFIQFYGGEPLVYQKAIIEITKKLCNIPNIRFSTISNGKLLTSDLVDFFNKYNFNFTVSWDGKNVLETRGYDAIHGETNVLSHLLDINNLGVSAVLSARNYPLETVRAFSEFNNKYVYKNKRNIGWNFDLVMDTGINNKYILNVDYERFEREMVQLTEDYVSMVNNDLSYDYITFNLIDQIIHQVAWYYDKDGGNGDNKGKVTCCCNNGYSILNLDLSGKLYSCHNTSDHIGTIYDNYFTYLNKIISSDTSIVHLANECKECSVVSVCNGGCKLVSDKAREESYCKLKRAFYLPVIKLIAKYGSSIIH